MKKCVFCDADYRRKETVLENDCFYSIFDPNPVTEGHMLVIAKRHVSGFFDLSEEEVSAAFSLLGKAKALLETKFKPQGFNVGVNCGKAAGQTIFHLHIHLIPRYENNTPDPTGGVRNVVPGKGNYLKQKVLNC